MQFHSKNIEANDVVTDSVNRINDLQASIEAMIEIEKIQSGSSYDLKLIEYKKLHARKKVLQKNLGR
jgi:hypothetical protein